MTDPAREPFPGAPDHGLSRRLEEAEQTLNAIRAGEVDAVVVDGPLGQQVYSLESADQPYRAFIERMQEGAVTLSEDGVILYANQFFADLAGVPLGSVIGARFERFVAVRARPLFRELLRNGLASSVRCSLAIVAAGAATVPVAVALSPLPTRRPRTCAAVVTDLTEQERLRDAEAAHAAAEAANVAKDQFLATLGHELRSPLNAILGWSHLLQRGALDAEVMRQGLETIERNARAQAQLIEDLLDVSRIVSGKLRLDVQPTDLAEVIDGALASIAPAAHAKGIQVARGIATTGLPVDVDPARIQQVIWNLLSNAVKFTPRGGTVQVTLERDAHHVRIRVIDSGQGIRAEFMPFVFQRFRQPATTARQHGGLGLGLSIVRQLVELHGGTVRADSAGEGRGATFTVELPAGMAHDEVGLGDAALRAVAVGDGVTLAGVRVLVVDDERDARDVIERVCGDRHAEVRTAESVADALALLDGFVPDVLVSDVRMPEQDGFDLIRSIRSLTDGRRHLRAVALTAFAREEDGRELLRAGFHAHVAKPVDPERLVRLIHELLERSSGGS